jgi:nucleoside-diphosphate-sugar epimerase
MGIRGAAIIGASGFLGSHLARGFEARGARVVPVLRAVDARSPAEAVSLADASEGSVSAERVHGLDVVVHAASSRSTAPTFTMRAVELDLLERAMRLASSALVRRFVLVSNVVVYGFPSRLPVTEDHPFAPRTAHAAVRLEIEMRARRLARELDLDLSIVRPARIYGPGDRSSLLEGLASMIRSGAYRVVGDGDNVLHHIHVDDAVEGIWLAATRPEASGEHFLLAGPETTTLAALSGPVARAIGRSLPRRRVPSGLARALATVVDVAASRGLAFVGSEPPHYHAKLDELTLPQWFDVTKARRRLGFLPRVVYEEGVARTLQGEWPALARAGAGS